MRRALLAALVTLAVSGCIPPGNGAYEPAYRPATSSAAPALNPLFTPGRYAGTTTDHVRMEVLDDGDVWIMGYACGDLRLRYQRAATYREVRDAGLRFPEPPAYLFEVVGHRDLAGLGDPCAQGRRTIDHMLIQPLLINTPATAAPFDNAMDIRHIRDGEYQAAALFGGIVTTPDRIRRLEP